MGRVQLALDSLDRLAELLEERGGRVAAVDAAAHVLALRHAPAGLARSLLEPLVAEDARFAWRGSSIVLAGVEPPLLEEAAFVVFDLETTGLAVASSRICEIGAVRIERLETASTFETLVAPGVPLPVQVGRLTGLSDEELRRAPRVGSALRRFRAFAGDALLVAHNARFDAGFVNRELDRLTGKRLAAPVLDTVPLARNLLRDRIERVSLASLAYFFGTSVAPCHRALPDAQATAEILLALIGLAQERGARTVADLEELAAPRPRRAHGKRHLVRGAPTRPGVYLFRDRHDQVLYVGKARDLRARLRSYFGSGRQRPSVEAALGAVEKVEWRLVGSELAAALEEIRLIRDLRPPANSRTPRPEGYVYLRRQGERVVVSPVVSPYGPIRRRAHALRAARALDGCTEAEFEHLLDGSLLQRLRRRMEDLAECLRYEEAGRLRDRIASLERVLAHLQRLERLRRLELCLIAPGLDRGSREAFVLSGGRIAARQAVEAGTAVDDVLAAAAAAAPMGEASREAGHLDELLVVASFVARPPPELRVLPLPAMGRSVR